MTRADLYTIALLSALPEEHKLHSVSSSPRILNVGDNEYGIFAVFTDNVPQYDAPQVEEGTDQALAIANQVAEICSVLQAGAGMMVVQRDMIPAVFQELDPPPPPPPVYKKMFTAREFMALFPPEVQRAIFTAAETDVDLRITLQLTSAGPVSVEDPDTIATMGGLLAAGLVNQELHDSILEGQLV